MNSGNVEINWREWTLETLELARSERRPILLAITATWCHWCHVMDHTTFGDEQVARIINTRFIPVRADNDRHPELNTRYNMGGWPTVAFLTPDGDVLTGATYVPARQMVGLLTRVAEAYEKDHDEIIERVGDMRRERLEQLSSEPVSTALLSAGIAQGIIGALENTFDNVYGGFGAQPKFPHVAALELLLSHHRRTGSHDSGEMVTKTLDGMQSGGVFDTVEGGFFRYSTTRDWSIPHYEKMLDDNSGLLSVYVQAYNHTENNRYMETARSIKQYLEAVLLDRETGAFFGSQDADEEYYKMNAPERAGVTSPSVDRTLFVNWNGMAIDAYLRYFQATGNAEALALALKALEFLISSCRGDNCFCHYYDGKPQGFGMLTDQVWAGLALLRAYECTGDRRYLEIARKTADCTIGTFADAGGGFFDISEERQQLQRLPNREKLLEENSYAARFFSRLSYYLHESTYRSYADKTLRFLAGIYETFSILAAPYAMAVTEFIEEPVRIGIFGKRNDIATEELLSIAFKSKEPSSLVEIITEASEDDLRQFGVETVAGPLAVVCKGEKCNSTSDTAQLRAMICDAESKRSEKVGS